jgi:hypothetical protein
MIFAIADPSKKRNRPPASRGESVELYLLAKDFKGRG